MEVKLRPHTKARSHPEADFLFGGQAVEQFEEIQGAAALAGSSENPGDSGDHQRGAGGRQPRVGFAVAAEAAAFRFADDADQQERAP
ncbi:MAG: hypothetical protein D6816_16605, partial [Bacteroidetes bacterium]